MTERFLLLYFKARFENNGKVVGNKVNPFPVRGAHGLERGKVFSPKLAKRGRGT